MLKLAKVSDCAIEKCCATGFALVESRWERDLKWLFASAEADGYVDHQADEEEAK